MAAPCSWGELPVSCCQDFWDTQTPEAKATASQVATYVLWAATGRRYGLCPVTVRPCGRHPCDDQIAGWFYNGFGTFVPYVLDGEWFNCACIDQCTCGARCRVYLPGPVGSITQVVLDGNVVDPATYRVDDGRWLARTGADNCWPTQQDFQVNSGADTFLVTYTRGEAVPAAVLGAAGLYACEWAKACQGMDCMLPSRAVTLNRQGTTVQLTDIDALLDRGFTGIQAVDQVIAADNPTQVPYRMRLASPEFPRIVMTTWP